jgi:hypothetical protein
VSHNSCLDAQDVAGIPAFRTGIYIPQRWYTAMGGGYKRCDACCKVFSCKYTLQRHWQRQPLCERWIGLQPGIKDYVDDKFALPMTDLELQQLDTKCFVCGTTFANVGNLNRHLDTSVVCGKWALYRDLKPLETHLFARHRLLNASSASDGSAELESSCKSCESVPPPDADAGLLHHIIWNVYLSDRVTASHANFWKVLQQNNIRHVFAILPADDVQDQEQAALFDAMQGVSYEVLRYQGHDPHVDLPSFDCAIEKMEEHRRNRQNVMVFCNKGYQRSLPFLCYYLVHHHADEVPDVTRAIDIILPQVDKAGYASVRERYIDTIGALLESSVSA